MMLAEKKFAAIDIVIQVLIYPCRHSREGGNPCFLGHKLEWFKAKSITLTLIEHAKTVLFSPAPALRNYYPALPICLRVGWRLLSLARASTMKLPEVRSPIFQLFTKPCDADTLHALTRFVQEHQLAFGIVINQSSEVRMLSEYVIQIPASAL